MDNKLVLVIIAIFLPWLAVYLYEGEITLNFWLSLLLWFLFWIPGFIYALLVIFDVI
ncbi:MAG: YqaE/Pmp3 family membrane protein [Bacteroidetes bacterium]|nr:YqaE/Pmp3 family membrane protein [Bacteroidota bacterium]